MATFIVASPAYAPAFAMSSAARSDGQMPILAGFKISRNITLSFDHQLGAAEAKRRVAERLEILRAEFADKVGSSAVNWDGDEAHVDVSAFEQKATGLVSVSDTTIRIKVHLPLLLAPLSSRIESFLTKTANETLQP